MKTQHGSRGKEYRAKIERSSQPTEYSAWFNTFNDLREAMRATYRTAYTTYTAQQRDVLCKDCAEKESQIEDVSPL
jgi:hypothetical protein